MTWSGANPVHPPSSDVIKINIMGQKYTNAPKIFQSIDSCIVLQVSLDLDKAKLIFNPSYIVLDNIHQTNVLWIKFYANYGLI